MRQALRLLCLLLSFTCLLPAVRAMPTRATEPGPTAGTPLPQPRWRMFAPLGGRFTVLLPATPVALAGSGFQTYTCHVNDVRYVVQYNDRSPKSVQYIGAEQTLKIVRDAFLKTSRSRLLSESRLTRNGFPGLKLVALRPRGRQETICTYVAGAREYHLIVAFPVRDAAAQADADKFLDSFAPAPVPLPDAVRK